MASFVDLPHVYNISVNKYRNFQESEGLRKFALINNFLYTKKFEALEQEPLEWSEESVKKDEENWLHACLDSLEEDENGYVYIEFLEGGDAMEIEGQDSDMHITEDIIIPDGLLHQPYFVPNTTYMAIDKDVKETLVEAYETVETQPGEIDPRKDEDINMIDCLESFHPHWKDNSIIAVTPPSADFHFNPNDVSRSFQRYRLGQDDVIVKPLDSCAVLGLLDHKYQQPPSHFSDNKRSKDDLDILCSLAPRGLVDQGALMDVINLLEFRGEKKNDNSNSPSSLEDDKLWFIR